MTKRKSRITVRHRIRGELKSKSTDEVLYYPLHVEVFANRLRTIFRSRIDLFYIKLNHKEVSELKSITDAKERIAAEIKLIKNQTNSISRICDVEIDSIEYSIAEFIENAPSQEFSISDWYSEYQSQIAFSFSSNLGKLISQTVLNDVTKSKSFSHSELSRFCKILQAVFIMNSNSRNFTEDITICLKLLAFDGQGIDEESRYFQLLDQYDLMFRILQFIDDNFLLGIFSATCLDFVAYFLSKMKMAPYKSQFIKQLHGVFYDDLEVNDGLQELMELASFDYTYIFLDHETVH
jgi:hypothetical protein